MANYSCIAATHQTLVGSTVDHVGVTGLFQQVMVTNRTGTSEIYVRLDGTDPTVGGQESFVLPAAVCSRVFDVDPTHALIVRLISSGAMAYSVEGVPGGAT